MCILVLSIMTQGNIQKKDTATGRYSVYFDASDIKKMAYLYEYDLKIPERYAANCELHDKTVEALR